MSLTPDVYSDWSLTSNTTAKVLQRTNALTQNVTIIISH